MNAAAPIAIEGVGKRYVTPSGPIPAVEGVSLTVRPREFVSLLGPSGCGKSTVLGMIGGLVRPDSGSILIDGEPVTGPNPKKVALVFQDPGLFPWRTALDNVGFGLELLGVPAARRREIALGLLEPMGRIGVRSCIHAFPAWFHRRERPSTKTRCRIARPDPSSAEDHRESRRRPYLDQLRRPGQPDDADGHAAVHPPDQRLLQEGGQLQGGDCAPLHALQFRPRP